MLKTTVAEHDPSALTAMVSRCEQQCVTTNLSRSKGPYMYYGFRIELVSRRAYIYQRTYQYLNIVTDHIR